MVDTFGGRQPPKVPTVTKNLPNKTRLEKIYDAYSVNFGDGRHYNLDIPLYYSYNLSG